MKWLIVFLIFLNLTEAHAAIYDDGQDTHGGAPIIAEVMKIRDDLFVQAMNIPDFVLTGYPNFKDKLTSAVANAELRLEGELLEGAKSAGNQPSSSFAALHSDQWPLLGAISR